MCKPYENSSSENASFRLYEENRILVSYRMGGNYVRIAKDDEVWHLTYDNAHDLNISSFLPDVDGQIISDILSDIHALHTFGQTTMSRYLHTTDGDHLFAIGDASAFRRIMAFAVNTTITD